MIEGNKLKLLFFSLVVFSLILNIFLVSAQDNNELIPDIIENSDIFKLFKNPAETSAIAEFAKLMILFLVILLIYSSLSYVEFPKNMGVRWLISIIVGFLATILIANEEIIAALQSYTALGVTLMLFFPVLILAFFTFLVASKVNPMGILVQRIMWIIYSVYLLINVGMILIIRWVGISSTLGKSGGGAANALTEAFRESVLVRFIFGENFTDKINTTIAGNTIILIALLIVSVAIFWIFVIKNSAFIEWLAKEKREADLARYRDITERSRQSREIDAGQTR